MSQKPKTSVAGVTGATALGGGAIAFIPWHWTPFIGSLFPDPSIWEGGMIGAIAGVGIGLTLKFKNRGNSSQPAQPQYAIGAAPSVLNPINYLAYRKAQKRNRAY